LELELVWLEAYLRRRGKDSQPMAPEEAARLARRIRKALRRFFLLIDLEVPVD
jgi:hypothetical protein